LQIYLVFLIFISGDVEVGGYIGNDVSTTSGDISCGEVKGSVKTLSGI